MTGHFVGRARELALLGRALAAARHGAGRLVVVTGEPGVGKTRVCHEVAARAELSGMKVTWGSCWPEPGAPGLWPWHAIMVGLNASLPDVAGRFGRFDVVADQVAAACRQIPTLIVIDDLHAAGPAAISLARFIARRLLRLPLVMLAAASADASSGQLRSLQDEATVLALRPFDLTETSVYLRAHGYAGIDLELRRALWRLTGGNPLSLQRAIALGPDKEGGGMPHEDLEALVVQAVDRLDAVDRRLLGQAATLPSSPLATDAASVAGCTVADFAGVLDRAARTGLVTVAAEGRFSFTHQLIRDSLQNRLTARERVEARARAARHTIDTRRATAAALMCDMSYGQAAVMLEEAVVLYEQAGLADPLAALLAEWALAVQSSGRPAEARKLFERAATTALHERDPVALARAALGLGGVRMNEHRHRAERERIIGLQRRALGELPEGEHALRCLLTARIAAEEACQGGPVRPVIDAVEKARTLGDGRVLAEVLSLCHQALLPPRFAHARPALAEELIAVASSSGADLFAGLGLLWRTVDLFQLGDPRAPHALAQLRNHAAEQDCGSIGYVAEVIDTMLLIRAGRLEDAEEQARTCLTLGTELVDPDVVVCYGHQLATIRWLQGPDERVLTAVECLITSTDTAGFATQATIAHLAAGAGQHEKARLALDQAVAPGLADLPESSTWLAGMSAIVHAAYDLGHSELAQQAYEMLTPYASLPVMPLLAVTCLGSVERPLGLAALTAGRRDLGIEHLNRAVTANRLLGHRPMTAITMADLAEALLRRGGPGDREQAVGHLAAARHEAETLGLTWWASRWKQRLEDIAFGHGTISRKGRHWLLALDGHEAVVPNRLGMAYLSHLLANPGTRIAALELAAGATATTSALATVRHQQIIDGQAKAAYRARAKDLARELAEAQRNADLARAEVIRVELDALVEELERAGAIGGRIRSFPTPGERARTAVRKAIKRALDEIIAADPTIGAILESTVTTGTSCCYTPDPVRPVTWHRQ